MGPNKALRLCDAYQWPGLSQRFICFPVLLILCLSIRSGFAANAVEKKPSLEAANTSKQTDLPIPQAGNTAIVHGIVSEQQHLIGQPSRIVAVAGDSFESLALKHRVGYDALLAANPAYVAFQVPIGAVIQLPTQAIVPDVQNRSDRSDRPDNFDKFGDENTSAVSVQGIIVNLPELRLYYYSGQHPQQVYMFPVGVGRAGWQTPVADTVVTEVITHPVWYAPASILAEYAKAGVSLQYPVPAGPENPLGDHALRLALPGYLLHGTNKPEGVGRRVSHGCLRMYPEHIAWLAERVKPGMPVRIINQPIKWGRYGERVFVEAHRALPDEVNAAGPSQHPAIKSTGRSWLAPDRSVLASWLQQQKKTQMLFSGLPALLLEP